MVICFACLLRMVAPSYVPGPTGERWELVGDRLTCTHDRPRTQSLDLHTPDGVPVCSERSTFVRSGNGTDIRIDDGSESWPGDEWTGRAVFTPPPGELLGTLR